MVSRWINKFYETLTFSINLWFNETISLVFFCAIERPLSHHYFILSSLLNMKPMIIKSLIYVLILNWRRKYYDSPAKNKVPRFLWRQGSPVLTDT